ncbi:hypothetical protein [Microbacterium sp. NPDC089695]|uniref:hypothetical protein n=1 Tax=Microbacterium sp. NPDC089695 TaxID=3364198 RepID=UPI00381C45E0
MRIRSLGAKIGMVVVALVLGSMITVVIAAGNSVFGAYVASVAVLVALVIFAARTFRGPKESSLPRPWWQMTAGAKSSAVLAAVFVLQAALMLFRASGTPLAPTGTLSALVFLAIAAAYLHSAFRLTRESWSPPT